MNNSMSIAVLSWNVNGKGSVEEGIQKVLFGVGTDIVLISLQEHFSRDCKIVKNLKKMIPEYKVVSVCRLQSLWSIVLSKEDRMVETMKIGFGRLGFFFNKGACFTRISPRVIFIGCHLINGPGANERRLEQVRTIFECICDEKTKKDVQVVVFAGDMNFRILGTEGCTDYSSTRRFDQCNKFKELYPMFKESQVRFNPTYKYINDTAVLSKSRNPSWPDRVFVSSTRNVIFREYKSFQDIKSSDHRPVLSVFSISTERNNVSILPSVKYHPHMMMRGITVFCCFVHENNFAILIGLILIIVCILFTKFKPILK